MGEVLESVSPRINLSGHVGKGCIVSNIGPILSLIIDSSQRSKHFLLLDTSSGQVEMHNDRKTIGTVRCTSSETNASVYSSTIPQLPCRSSSMLLESRWA